MTTTISTVDVNNDDDDSSSSLAVDATELNNIVHVNVGAIKSIDFKPSDFIEPNSIEAIQSSNKKKSVDETSETKFQNTNFNDKNEGRGGIVNYQKMLEEKLINFRNFITEHLNTDVLKPICNDLIRLTTVPFITFIKLIEIHILPAKGQLNIWLDNKIEFLKIPTLNISSNVKEKILRYLLFFSKFVDLYKANVKNNINIKKSLQHSTIPITTDHQHINKKQKI